jgi:3-phytase
MRRIHPGPAHLLANLLLILLVAGCKPGDESSSQRPVTDPRVREGEPAPTDLTGVTIIPERWVSTWDTTSNLDSPAVWQGQEGTWVVSTAKGTHELWVHDARDGSLLDRIGRKGEGEGEFNYPNGIAILGDLLLVVERDNHRVQMMSMPGFEPLGWFGSRRLERPYGIALFPRADGVVVVFVTDDYGNELDPPHGADPMGDFTHRVNRFELRAGAGARPQASFVGAFGEATGPGALMVVESIQVDEDRELLMVADEHNLELELYGLDGAYLGRTEGSGIYRHGDPEGIMLYRCGSGGGYWILTDQGATRSVFHVLDRNSFELLGSFAGEVTANTDGIWLHQGEVPGLGHGVLVAVHDDGGVAAFAWEDIAGPMGLATGCPPAPGLGRGG